MKIVAVLFTVISGHNVNFFFISFVNRARESEFGHEIVLNDLAAAAKVIVKGFD